MISGAARPGVPAERDLPRVIDVHAHYVPPRLRQVLPQRASRHGLDVETIDGGTAIRLGPTHTTRRLHPDMWDLEARLDRMDAAGVDVQILSAWTELAGYHLDREPALQFATIFNDLLAEDVATNPRRFVGLATVPVQHPHAAANELRRAVVDLGLVGAEVAASVGGPDLGDLALAPLWSTAEELSCLILVHPIGDLRRCGLDGDLDSLVGRPAETTIVMTRAIVGGLLDRHPELRLCIVHGGGFLPYQLGRLLRRAETANAAGLPDFDAALRRLYFDSVLNSPAALRLLVDLVGSERVLLGTDDPFEGGDPTPLRSIDAVADLDPQERRDIVGGNAERLLAGVRR